MLRPGEEYTRLSWTGRTKRLLVSEMNFSMIFRVMTYSTANHIDMDKLKATVLLSDAMPIGAEFAIMSTKEER